jgi:hypothetical protein
VPWGIATSRALRLAAASAVGALFLLRLFLMRVHAFDPDEFQHLHGAYCLAKGLLPYRDYFDHHPPWLHYFLALFVPLFDVETSPAAAAALIFGARLGMWVLTGLALALTYRLGREGDGAATAWAGTVLLSTTVMFLDKMIEIRPDVPALAFLLGSWAELARGMRGSDRGERARGAFARSGFLLGAALLCTQKLVFTLPASLLLGAAHLLERRGAAPRSQRLRSLCAFAAGAAAPIAVVLSVFAAQGALAAFVQDTLLVNLRWPVSFSAEPRIRQLLAENALLVGLGLCGLVLAAIALARTPQPRAAAAVVPAHALGLTAGAFVIPVPTAQYLVPLLPLVALLGAGAAVRLLQAAWNLPRRPLRVAAVTLAAAVLLAGSVRPLRTMLDRLRPGHTKVADQIAAIGAVLTRTRPTDTIFDGFSGVGVFRPHAYFYYFLHDEVRMLLAGRPLGRLLADLRDGAIAPDWVVADADVLALPDDLVAFLRANYVPGEPPWLWQRKPLWVDDAAGGLDLGRGPADVLAGRGWSAPKTQGGRAFRTIGGRRSTLRLPVRDAAGCRRLVLTARAEGAVPLQVTVNGVAAGLLHLGPDWADHALDLARPLLHAGVNAVELTDATESPGAAPIAVDRLRVECDRRR